MNKKQSYKPKNKQGQKNTNRRNVASTRISIKEKCLFLDEDGKGVVKYDNKNVPVENLLPNELAMIDLVKRGKYYQTKIQSIIEKSKRRVQPECPYFYECGGCQLQHMSYQGQLNHKSSLVSKVMKDFGSVKPIIAMDEPWHYRNKITASFALEGKNVITGFYKLYSHEVYPIDKCMIQDPAADKILETIRVLAKKFKYRIYNEDTENGFLRHVLIRTGFKSNEIMVVFVVASKMFPSKGDFIKELTKTHPEISTIIMNVNNQNTSVVLGHDEHVLYGSGMIKDQLCGYDFNFSSKSFYQINPVQTEKLYKLAMDFANIQKNEIVLDTYSGIGTISIIAAKYAKEVYGVEVNKAAVKNAIKNAKQNGVKNVRFVESDATYAMVQMAEESFKIDTLFMDPPRDGSTPEFIQATLKLAPKKIVYISCNPITQARDLKLFIKKYLVKEIVPVDLFPHTSHVESVVLLTRK